MLDRVHSQLECTFTQDLTLQGQFQQGIAMQQVLERGQEISKREWKLIRVAIVEMRDNTYIGRIFFGDRDSGESVYDIDCRPSDGLWLSLKVTVP